jgi:heat-inducible transcriptional repressor
VISGSGAVAKRVFAFDAPVDHGLTEWAREYLNETLTGGAITERSVRRRMEDPELPVRERAFLDAIAPVFHELFEAGADRLVVGGASRLMSELRAQNQQELSQLAAVLEERATMLGQLRAALRGDSITVRIGEEHEEAALRPVAMITAGYGLPHRTLGAVSVIGPMRMDYAQAIVAVRGAAAVLSAYVEDVYED